MHGAFGHGALRRDQRLRQHLPAKYPLPTVLEGMAGESVGARRLQVQQRHEVGGHGHGTLGISGTRHPFPARSRAVNARGNKSSRASS